MNSKWIKGLNLRPDTIQLSEKNIGRTHFDVNHSNIFFSPSLRVMEMKTKINKWDLVKFKSSCTAKETIQKLKDNPQNGRKYLQTMRKKMDQSADFTYSSCRPKKKPTNNPTPNQAEDLNKYLTTTSTKTIQMANRHTKRCSASLIMGEMQIKTTMNYHLTPLRLSIIKCLQINAGEDMEGRELSCTVGGNVNQYICYREQYGISL